MALEAGDTPGARRWATEGIARDSNSGELYRLDQDPRERNNLMAGGKSPNVVKRLRKML